MSDKTESDRPGIKGIWDLSEFNDPDRSVPDQAERQALVRQGEKYGFVSREPVAPARAPRRAPLYTDRVAIRARPEDRQRFEDFVYKHRITNGEALTRLLDLADRAGEGGAGEGA